MKATTIIRTTGLSILMGLTTVGMANAQRSTRSDANIKRDKAVKYEINDRAGRNTRQAPTTVYKSRNQDVNNGRSTKGNKTTTYQKQTQKKNHQKVVSHKSQQAKQTVYHKGNKHSGGVHSTWNYDYNRHPVHRNYNNRYYQTYQHRSPNLRVQLPQGFFGLTLDDTHYFHYDGIFYRQHPRGGFVAVAPPKYFRHIPAGSVQIVIDGRVYFRYHNLVFKHTAFGFRFA